MWNGAKWYYCCKETGGKCTGNWGTHIPRKCEGKRGKGGSKKAPPAVAAKKKSGTPGLKMINAHQSILRNKEAEQAMEQDEEDDQSMEEADDAGEYSSE